MPQREYAQRNQVLRALEATSNEVTAALRAENAILDTTLLQTIGMGIEHACEHYGQRAVYARILGLVPPSSRV